MDNKDRLFQSHPSLGLADSHEDELNRVKKEMKTLEEEVVSKDEEIRRLNDEIRRLEIIIESAVTDLTRAIKPATDKDGAIIPRNRNPAFNNDFPSGSLNRASNGGSALPNRDPAATVPSIFTSNKRPTARTERFRKYKEEDITGAQWSITDEDCHG